MSKPQTARVPGTKDRRKLSEEEKYRQFQSQLVQVAERREFDPELLRPYIDQYLTHPRPWTINETAQAASLVLVHGVSKQLMPLRHYWCKVPLPEVSAGDPFSVLRHWQGTVGLTWYLLSRPSQENLKLWLPEIVTFADHSLGFDLQVMVDMYVERFQRGPWGSWWKE